MSKWVLICALAAGLGILSAGATLQMANPTPRGPYHLDFAASLYNGKVIIDPSFIRVLGKHDRECAGWQFDTTFAPEVTLSIGGKRISLERMKFA
jgi:hypothetical protein